MTATRAVGAGGRSLRLGGFVALLIAAVVLVSTISRTNPPPYDLAGTGDGGLRGLQLVLQGLGSRVDGVDAGVIDASAVGRYDTIFVPLAGSGSSAQVDRWHDYVRAGGHLVLGTPTAGLGVAPPGDTSDPVDGQPFDLEAQPGSCDIATLAPTGDLTDLAPNSDPSLTVPTGARSCYGEGTTAQIVETSIGQGTVVDLSSGDLFTNGQIRAHTYPDHLPMYGNVVVAQRLLAPTGRERVGVVQSGVIASHTGPGSRSVLSYIRPGVQVGLLELVVAFVCFALWRARRHGRVVVESQPVEIAGSELVAAVGDLQRRQHHPDRAAATVRHQVNRDLARRLGMPSDTDPSVVAAVVAGRLGRDPGEVAAAMSTRPVQTDSDLIEVERALETIRQEILHG